MVDLTLNALSCFFKSDFAALGAFLNSSITVFLAHGIRETGAINDWSVSSSACSR